jgi:hypothetical protein
LQYWRDKNVFDQDYYNFIWDVANAGEIKENKDLVPYSSDSKENDSTAAIIELSTRFVLDTFARARNRGTLGDWLFKLYKLFNASVPGCLWFLQQLTYDSTWFVFLFFVVLFFVFLVLASFFFPAFLRLSSGRRNS